MSISFLALLVVYEYLLFWHYLWYMGISFLALLVVYEYLLFGTTCGIWVSPFWHYLWYMSISFFLHYG